MYAVRGRGELYDGMPLTLGRAITGLDSADEISIGLERVLFFRLTSGRDLDGEDWIGEDGMVEKRVGPVHGFIPSSNSLDRSLCLTLDGPALLVPLTIVDMEMCFEIGARVISPVRAIEDLIVGYGRVG